MHFGETRKPVLFQGLPIETAGIVEAQDETGNTGTSAASVAVGASGSLEETDGVVVVLTGGTIGTDQILLSLSLDGGVTFKKLRLGTLNSYVIPHVGLTLSFGAGTLIAGDTALEWHSTAPQWDQAGLTAARAALANQQKQVRSVLLVGDLELEADADDLVTEMNLLETTNKRFAYARAQIRDIDYASTETIADHLQAMDAEFADVDAERRVDLAFGRARKTSPVLGYRLRRGAAWAASLREYQHDVHIPTWRKADGKLLGWDLEDADGVIVEHNDDPGGLALAARFTCFRTWPNGPAGTFIAQSLTRAGDDAALSLTHNMAVANVACSVTQRETENAVGQSLILNDDGTATAEALGQIRERVQTALQNALLSDVKGEGPRASSATWTPASDDDLSGPNATLNGVLALNLRGTIVHINTQVQVGALS
jgi:hypothetical protein